MRIVSAEAHVEQITVRAKTLADAGARGGLCEASMRSSSTSKAPRNLVLDPFLQRRAARAVAAADHHGIRAAARSARDAGERLRALGYREILRTRENVAYELDARKTA